MDKPCKDSWRSKNKDGYHRMNKNTYGYDKEHRYVYAWHHGIDLRNDSRLVRHLCNNSWCIEITHLALGDFKDNVQDAIKAGNHINPPIHIGSNNSISKLTETEAIQIQDLWDCGAYTQKEIAEMYKVARSTITGIIYGKTWRHTK